MLKTLTSKAKTTEDGHQNIGPRGRIAFFKLVPTSKSRQQQPASHEGQMVFSIGPHAETWWIQFQPLLPAQYSILATSRDCEPSCLLATTI